MAPRRGGTTTISEEPADICEFAGDEEYPVIDSERRLSKPYCREIVWRNVILFVFLHIGAVYGLYLFVFRALWCSVLFSIKKIFLSEIGFRYLSICWWFIDMMLAFFAGVGITAGAHRLWAHKSYKASNGLKIILIIFNNIAFQVTILFRILVCCFE